MSCSRARKGGTSIEQAVSSSYRLVGTPPCTSMARSRWVDAITRTSSGRIFPVTGREMTCGRECRRVFSERPWKRLNVFQKQRAAGPARETACLFNSTRFGRAGAFAKEFPLEAFGRVHAAVEHQEGTARPSAGEVNDAGDLLASGAGFSVNEHRTVFVRRPADCVRSWLAASLWPMISLKIRV